MIRKRNVVTWGAALAVLTQWLAAPPRGARAGVQESSVTDSVTGNPAPTSEQIRSLIARMAENQHHNERVMEEFERVEHVVSRKPGENSQSVTDRTDRILPSGNGNIKLQMAENGLPVSQERYRAELQYAVSALTVAVHPNEHYKQELAKFEKRRRDRAEMIDTAVRAFRITWAGRETRGSRTLAKFLLEPDPGYKPSNRLAVMFEHVRATLWVDESQAQFARLEGDIASDITFGGGIAGKVYHGGHFVIEQSEITPGIWLPTLYTYDLDGRKFLFGFGIHEQTEISHYRRVGPPEEAIQLIRGEWDSLAAKTPAH
jgi:hypothetical protein